MSRTGGSIEVRRGLAAWKRRLLGAERTIAVRYSGAAPAVSALFRPPTCSWGGRRRSVVRMAGSSRTTRAIIRSRPIFPCGSEATAECWGVIKLRGVMLGAWGVDPSSSRLAVWKRRLLGAVALGALLLPGGLAMPEPAWGQVSETLPEVIVSAPRSALRPPRRPEPAARRAAPSRAAPSRP